MRTHFHKISELNLASVHGGGGGPFAVQDRGWRGVSVTTSGGNAVSISPLATTISLSDSATNRVSNGLNVVAAGTALPFPPVAVAAGIASSVMSLVNSGKGVNITFPHVMPEMGGLITPRH